MLGTEGIITASLSLQFVCVRREKNQQIAKKTMPVCALYILFFLLKLCSRANTFTMCIVERERASVHLLMRWMLLIEK